MTSATEQLETLCRGVVEVHVRAELLERLESKKRLRIKAGFDPTRPDLHLGHTVLMQKMRQFQEFGHEVVFLVGDFTAMVGDPTGKSELRPRLSRDEVRAAAETYQAQAFKVLDKDKTIVRYNAEWLEKLTMVEIIDLGAKYTLARTVERRDFKQRIQQEQDIYMHELLYPLLQGYDSVAIAKELGSCDVELGGTDQLFNLLVGRRLMPRYELAPQIVMTTPLLEGINARVEDGKIVGAKMSKSSNNFVAIDEPPLDMLNKLMLVDDGVIWRYFELLSAKSNQEIAELKADVTAGRRDVIAVKEAFAVEMVTRFHDANAAREALERRHAVARGDAPTNAEEIRVKIEGADVWIAKALSAAGLAESTSKAARLVKDRAVHVDGSRVEDEQMKLARGGRYLVRVGSKNRRFAVLVIE